MGAIKLLSCLAAASILSFVSASPCPYGQLAERGQLPAVEAAKFFEARTAGDITVEDMLTAVKERDFEQQEERQLGGLLGGLLGGGLLNGILQPFTGVLALLDVPTPQQFGLQVIPDALHLYVAPKKTDIRGVCPALNTMANHGYISRTGITTFAEAANACQIAFGFGYDTCTFLSGLALLSGGDLPSGLYSIGGADSRVPNTFGPSLGLSHHGPFEVDNSITRIDAYFGNQANFNLTRWNQVVGLSAQYGGELFGANLWSQERVIRYQQSLATNPEFDAGAKWLVVANAERAFVYRGFPNGTNENVADFPNVGSFYLNETFPHNWSRRATAYSLADTASDISNLILNSPSLTVPGHNEGLNNFIPDGIDLSTFTPENVLCLLAANLVDVAPGDFSPSLVNEVAVVSAFIAGAIAPFFTSSGCNLADYTVNGVSAASSTAGPNTNCNILVNGVYQC